MFEATSRFAFFDYFRVPYEIQPRHGPSGEESPVNGIHQLRARNGDGDTVGSLLWHTFEPTSSSGANDRRLLQFHLGESTLFGHVASDDSVSTTLPKFGSGWLRAEPLVDSAQGTVANIWRDAHGNVFLPFDPGEVMERFWSESYRQVERSKLVRSGRAVALRAYYAARPVVPRPIQIGMRRAFSRVQTRSSFPQWPMENSLHDLYSWLFATLAGVAGRPVPFLELWPKGRKWALVLTHDVETDAGCHQIETLRRIERERGYRSSWNFVPRRYSVHESILQSLRAEACEIGVHGLWHDGRDLRSRRLMEKRLPEMRQYAAQWNAVGFRSPATQRNPEWMPELGFDYDSSFTDTDRYEPQPGGCCTYLPYFNKDMVELPITMPQDHTLFSILEASDGELWLGKAANIRDRGGMVLVLTHPDYSGDERITDSYRVLLETFEGDDSMWHALPKDVSEWWRRRNASRLVQDGTGWTVAGLASSDGEVGFATADKLALWNRSG
jgi:hypothetical protein